MTYPILELIRSHSHYRLARLHLERGRRAVGGDAPTPHETIALGWIRNVFCFRHGVDIREEILMVALFDAGFDVSRGRVSLDERVLLDALRRARGKPKFDPCGDVHPGPRVTRLIRDAVRLERRQSALHSGQRPCKPPASCSLPLSSENCCSCPVG